MRVIEAKVRLVGITPLSQSRKHSVPLEEGENPEAYDKRTWRDKAHFAKTEKGSFLSIPAHGLQQCLTEGAKHVGKKIQGRGNKTWAGMFEKGVACPFDAITDVREEDVTFIDIFANLDGVRGSGKRGIRRFPQTDRWNAEATFWVMEPTITESIFMEMLRAAGLFIGVGRFRPKNGGTNGRFAPDLVAWEQMKDLAA